MTDPIGRFMLMFLERRFEKMGRNHQLMRIIGKKFTIWVTKRD